MVHLSALIVQTKLPAVSFAVLRLFYASAPLGGADAYMFYRCFFVFFPSATIVHKYETTVLGNG